jgi:PAS domain S-box-containing protein
MFYESSDMFLSIVHPEDREIWRNHSRMAERNRQPGQAELRIISRQGETRWIRHICRPVIGESGRFLGIRGSNSDITERKRSEEALRESEERLRDFFDNAIDLIQSVSPDGRFLYVNRAWRESLGYTDREIATLSVFDIIAPDCLDHCKGVLRRVMSGEKAATIETTFLAKDGRRIVVEGNVNCRFEDGMPTASRGIFRDVTGKKRMEEELRKANTLESIGILAGGIAHDFNNILTAVMGYISLAKMGIETGGQTWSRLVEAEKASIRAQGLTRQLLTFSKGGAPIKQAASITEIIEESAGFALLGSNVKCRISIDPDLSPVNIDPGQIHQVINNIVLNAAQAMPEGGIVDVEARNVSDEGVPGRTLPRGEYVKIIIADHGTGIPEEHIPKIFNPFFTTKAKGTGLGLATSYSIIKRHDGQISVDSRLGSGTTVSLFLPASRKTAPSIPGGAPRPIEGMERILVMDDEEMVRNVAVTILETMGFRASAVKDGSEAVDSYLEAMKAGTPFHIVILDLTVPGGMGGKEAVRKLLDIDPGAKVIVSSGYSQDPILSRYRDYGFGGVIAKPYQIGELGQAIRLLLPGEDPPARRS